MDDFGAWLTKHVELWMAIVISVSGGLVAYLQALAEPGAKFVWVFAVARVTLAGFVGVLTFLLLSELSISSNMKSFLTGVMGYFGVEGINLLKEVAFDFIRRAAPADKNQPPKG